jgi:hypothetical protein
MDARSKEPAPQQLIVLKRMNKKLTQFSRPFQGLSLPKTPGKSHAQWIQSDTPGDSNDGPGRSRGQRLSEYGFRPQG